MKRTLGLFAAALVLSALPAVAFAQTASSPDAQTALPVLEYLTGSIFRPLATFRRLSATPIAAALGWGITIAYGIMYAQTALLLGLRGIRPVYPHPLMPVPDEKFYLVQAGHTVPSSLVFIGAGYGVAYGMTRLLGAHPDAGALWAAYGSAMVLPTFVTMWVPETVWACTVKDSRSRIMPEALDVARQIVGAVWAAALVAVAVQAVGDIAWWQSALTGVLGAGVTGVLFGMFYR